MYHQKNLFEANNTKKANKAKKDKLNATTSELCKPKKPLCYLDLVNRIQADLLLLEQCLESIISGKYILSGNNDLATRNFHETLQIEVRKVLVLLDSYEGCPCSLDFEITD